MASFWPLTTGGTQFELAGTVDSGCPYGARVRDPSAVTSDGGSRNRRKWISSDGHKWADGLFIFALDPVGRHVGTYMGEGRKVSLEQRKDSQDATKKPLRDAQWPISSGQWTLEYGACLVRTPIGRRKNRRLTRQYADAAAEVDALGEGTPSTRGWARESAVSAPPGAETAAQPAMGAAAAALRLRQFVRIPGRPEAGLWALYQPAAGP